MGIFCNLSGFLNAPHYTDTFATLNTTLLCRIATLTLVMTKVWGLDSVSGNGMDGSRDGCTTTIVWWLDTDLRRYGEEKYRQGRLYNYTKKVR